MGKLYVVVGIGCLECNTPSELIGVFASREQALAAGPDGLPVYVAEALTRANDWRAEGRYVLFEADAPT